MGNTISAGCTGATERVALTLRYKERKTSLEVPTIRLLLKRSFWIASVAAYNTNFPLPGGGKSVQAPTDENSQKFFSSDSHPYTCHKPIFC